MCLQHMLIMTEDLEMLLESNHLETLINYIQGYLWSLHCLQCNDLYDHITLYDLCSIESAQRKIIRNNTEKESIYFLLCEREECLRIFRNRRKIHIDIFLECLICDGISEILMLDECICSFLLVTCHKKLLIFVKYFNTLWVPYWVFEKGMRKNNISWGVRLQTQETYCFS